MASPWQYNYPGEQRPVLPTDQGYAVNLPDRPNRDYRPTPKKYTAYLEAPDGTRRYLWLHEIGMSFQVAGSYAQSPKFRAWYPRNFIQPQVEVQGQCSSQADYGALCEFVRQGQRAALDTTTNPALEAPLATTLLHIPSGGPGHPGHNNTGHSMRGFINAIERSAERWVNAPEFTFTFTVVTAHAGLFHTDTSDGSGMMKEITTYMRPTTVEQINNQIRSGANVQWALDPDKGSGAAGYDKGSQPG